MGKIAVLCLFVLPFLSCTKHVTEVQQVDQAFSAVYQLNSNAWSTSDGSISYSTTLQVPEIDDVLNANGAVIVYLSFDNGTHYEALPEVFNGISYGAVHNVGSVIIDLFAVDGGTISAPGGTILAKVVLIDATALGN